MTIYSKQNNQLTSYLSKKGESAKLREEMNLNYHKYHYIFVRQLPRTFSLAFRENKLKRPDYIVFLFLMGSMKFLLPLNPMQNLKGWIPNNVELFTQQHIEEE